VEDPDFTPGRPQSGSPEELHSEAWEAQPLTDDQRRNNLAVIRGSRPRVILRLLTTRSVDLRT